MTGAARPLTAPERAALSLGLVAALDAAGVHPLVLDRVHPAARIAALWRGRPPILARPARIFWPGAPDDCSRHGPLAMSDLQHELQHLLDYATGAMTGLGYLLRPADWRYGYVLTASSRWSDFGAEQRASIAEHHWLIEAGRRDLAARSGATGAPEDYRSVIPWA